MDATGMIEMRQEWHPDPLGSGSGYAIQTPVAWRGGPIARIDHVSLRLFTHSDRWPNVGEYLFIGPWLVEVVARGEWVGMDVFVTRNTQWAWWYALRWRVGRRWQWAKVRLIATCAIWGLGRYDWSSDPSWTEIHAVAWLKGKWDALHDRHHGR